MKDYRLSEIKAICEAHYKCEDCEFSVEWIRPRDGKSFYDCSMILDDSQPYNWQIDKESEDETKEQLIADLNKVAVRTNWGTIERTINNDGTNGMPYMIDVIARTIAYLKGEQYDNNNQ